MTTTKSKSKKRAVGYARTSGEKQRDNTSIPRQKAEIEKFIANQEWQFIHHYVDESLSGSKIEGRDDFKQMMKDAANGQFDIIVIYDIDRFARDGSDIISESRTLKKHFEVDVIDTKGYDTRKPRNTLLNFVKAGVAEDERLRIMERTINARIHNAKKGLQWSPKPPFGREFIKTDKHSGYWQRTENGKKIETILKSYVNDDKSFRELAREHGILSAQRITRLVREAQLAANPYKVIFNSPDIGIENLDVSIPAVPPVISQKLEKRVLSKMALNKKTKRSKKRNYLLSGMIKCAHCGMYLKGQSQRGRSYYTHNNFYAEKKPCPYNGVRLEILETHVMDYLTNFFFDESTFEQAINNALPSNEDREAIQKDIESNKKTLNKANSKISNLCNAIAEGEKLTSLLEALKSAEAEKEVLLKRELELQETLATMPDPDTTKAQAEVIRMKIMMSKITENWQNRNYKELRNFLHFLFSDNPRQNNYGILLGKKDKIWHIDFEGCFDFNVSITTDNTTNDDIHNALKQINAETRDMFEKAVQNADDKYVKSSKEAGIEVKHSELFNSKDYL